MTGSPWSRTPFLLMSTASPRFTGLSPPGAHVLTYGLGAFGILVAVAEADDRERAVGVVLVVEVVRLGACTGSSDRSATPCTWLRSPSGAARSGSSLIGSIVNEQSVPGGRPIEGSPLIHVVVALRAERDVEQRRCRCSSRSGCPSRARGPRRSARTPSAGSCRRCRCPSRRTSARSPSCARTSRPSGSGSAPPSGTSCPAGQKPPSAFCSMYQRSHVQSLGPPSGAMTSNLS